MRRAILDQILAARADKRPVVLATGLVSGEQTLLHPWGGDPQAATPELLVAAREAVDRDRSFTIEGSTESGVESLFLQVFNPPMRMIIVGAVHIAQALSRMAALVGFEVTIVDPRQAFASDARFPAVDLVTQWPHQALTALAPDRRTAVVTLTHDPKLDDPALAAALGSAAIYIGALGSKRTRAARSERLRERGFGDDDLARISGPIGLDIGAKTPAEIAVAILAEVVQRVRLGGP